MKKSTERFEITFVLRIVSYVYAYLLSFASIKFASTLILAFSKNVFIYFTF